jgi:hypothetical protein
VNSELLHTYLSPTFLLRDNFAGLTVIRISDIVRVERRAPKNAADPATPHRVEVEDKFGVKVVCEGPGAGVDRFVQALKQGGARQAGAPAA